MQNDHSGLKLVLYAGLVLVLLFGLVQLIMAGQGLYFRLELLGLAVLVVLSFIGFVGYALHWGERVFLVVFVLYMINLGLIWYAKGTLYLVLLVLALAGLVMSLLSHSFDFGAPKAKGEPHSVVFDQPKPTPVEEKPKKATAKFSPGKYVASTRSNNYHEPKCDWAKKIDPQRRVWFTSKEEAWEKGYRSHSCIN